MNNIKHMKRHLIGVDIGGTKCAVVLGREENGGVQIIKKKDFPTSSHSQSLTQIMDSISCFIDESSLDNNNTHAIGISCGGPLDDKRGVILSPPNLPGWDEVAIVEILQTRFGLPAILQNDANACALAEWKFGAGQGSENMIFLTFGTGLGAGIILNGALYTGTSGNAGEVGHIRLAEFGPVGYGKSGSFEGFCSGGGIAQLAQSMVMERLQLGEKPTMCDSYENLELISARSVAEAADAGDTLAQQIYATSGEYLGKGLSLLIDILNPEVIVIGSIYERAGHLLREQAFKVIEQEALPLSRQVCRIESAQLGDDIGDYAALSVAANYKGK